MGLASTKSLTLLLAALVGSTTTASNLRGGRTPPFLQHRGHNEAAKRYLRTSSASTGVNDEGPAESHAAPSNAKADEPRPAHRSLSSDAIPPARAMQDTTPDPPNSYITSDKGEYEDGESVHISFALPPSGDVSNYKIGIFMRMANPQGGALEPLVSLPLCSQGCQLASDPVTGSVTFSSDTMMIDTMPAVTEAEMEDTPEGVVETDEGEESTPVAAEGSAWPIDLFKWGTGFDAYVLDEDGDDVVGPVMFNILMDE